MPTEHRFIAALILLGGIAATLVGSWSELDAPSVVAVAACIVAGGLLPATPRMVNAVATVIGGSLVAISAILDGGGTRLVLVLPIAAASVLLLGAAGFGWSVVLSVLPVALVDADRLGTAALARPVDAWALLVLVGWLAWLVVGAATALRRRRHRVRAGVLLGMTASRRRCSCSGRRRTASRSSPSAGGSRSAIHGPRRARLPTTSRDRM